MNRGDALVGNCAVMFKAPAVAVEYLGREREKFVIFQPTDAQSYVFLDPVIQYGKYAVASTAESEEAALFMSESLPDVIEWVQNNYETVRHHLIAPTELIAGSPR